MNKRIDSVDGWRAIAALGVLYTHTWATLKLPALFIAHIDVMRIINLWGNGVHLFFVISGFCFYLVLSKQKMYNLKTALSFWKKRWLRIAPAFYSACLIAAFFIFRRVDANFFYRLLANFTFLQNYLPNAEVEGIFWSLAVEWHFYLLLPLIFIFITRYGLMKSVVVIILFGISLNLLHYSGYLMQGDMWWYTIFANVEHFAWGILIAYIFKEDIKVPLVFSKSIGLVIGLIVAYLGKTFFTASFVGGAGSYGFIFQSIGPLIMTLGFAIAIYVTLVNRNMSSLIGNRVLVFVGKISYSFYLWHALVLEAVYYYTKQFIPAGPYGVFILMFLVLIILIPVSLLSYKLLEEYYFKRQLRVKIA